MSRIARTISEAPNERSVSPAQQRYPERADFPECVAAADYRILLHYLPRGLLVRSIEDDQAGVDRAQRRAGEDEPAASQQALQSLEMLCPDGLLIGCHRRGEVITRRVDEIDPFRHGPSLPVRRSLVNVSLRGESGATTAALGGG
jgi:hypothetical protein